MKRETVEQILTERQLKSKNGTFAIPDGDVFTLFLGGDRESLRVNVCSLSLKEHYLSATSPKGRQTYVEYGAVEAMTFEPRHVADRRTGFV